MACCSTRPSRITVRNPRLAHLKAISRRGGAGHGTVPQPTYRTVYPSCVAFAAVCREKHITDVIFDLEARARVATESARREDMQFMDREAHVCAELKLWRSGVVSYHWRPESDRGRTRARAGPCLRAGISGACCSG